MKRTQLLALLGGLVVALAGSFGTSAPGANAKPTANRGETLVDAVVRINAEVERDYGILSPTPLTGPKLKAAIEFAANEIADSDWPGRTSYAFTLAEIAATGHIPDSVTLCFTPIATPSSKQQKKELRDGRHVAISLNYTMLMNSKHGNRLIGLTQIVEIFQIIKPHEQIVPFQPPRVEDRGEENAG